VDRGGIILVDEASQLGTRDMGRVFDVANVVGARVILVVHMLGLPQKRWRTVAFQTNANRQQQKTVAISRSPRR